MIYLVNKLYLHYNQFILYLEKVISEAFDKSKTWTKVFAKFIFIDDNPTRVHLRSCAIEIVYLYHHHEHEFHCMRKTYYLPTDRIPLNRYSNDSIWNDQLNFLPYPKFGFLHSDRIQHFFNQTIEINICINFSIVKLIKWYFVFIIIL